MPEYIYQLFYKQLYSAVKLNGKKYPERNQQCVGGITIYYSLLQSKKNKDRRFSLSGKLSSIKFTIWTQLPIKYILISILKFSYQSCHRHKC